MHHLYLMRIARFLLISFSDQFDNATIQQFH